MNPINFTLKFNANCLNPLEIFKCLSHRSAACVFQKEFPENF